MKRAFDLLLTLFLVFLLSPIFILVASAVYFNFGRPILYTQVRPGRNGKPFSLYKFRSMIELLDGDGRSRPDNKRLTRFGKFLRSTSLDELPEFVNILRGDMSLVGPRPLLMEYLPLYSLYQKRRHLVRPGLTGWAQVNGRNALTWEEKFALDVWYVDNRTFLLDIWILFLTIKKVLLREDISAAGEVTMPAFKGENREQDSD